MSADYERRLLARARRLTDLSDIKDAALACLGGARHAGLNPDALHGLVGCAAALGATSLDTYTAGEGSKAGTPANGRSSPTWPASKRHRRTPRRGGPARPRGECRPGDRPRGPGDRPRPPRRPAPPTREPCGGCHARRAAAIAAAGPGSPTARPGSACADIGQALPVLRQHLERARAGIRAVPADLGETYEAVYRLIRRGGRLPYEGRWIQGVPA